MRQYSSTVRGCPDESFSLAELLQDVAQEFDRRGVAELLVALGADQSPPEFPVIEGPYLGQEPPGSEPKICTASGRSFGSLSSKDNVLRVRRTSPLALTISVHTRPQPAPRNLLLHLLR